jgi:hypothetical protein
VVKRIMMLLWGGKGGGKLPSLGDAFHRPAGSIRDLLSDDRKPNGTY